MEWSEWSECTLTCGSGIRTRTRTHQTLGGDENDILACNTDPCRKFIWNLLPKISVKILACELFSLTCGMLIGKISLNEDCFASKFPSSSAEDIFLQVTSNPS